MDKRTVATTRRVLLECAIFATASVPVTAEPDVIIGSIPTTHHWTSGGAIDGLRAYSFAKTPCNIGTSDLDWFAGPDTRRVVTAPNLYRLKDGRFEQIGQGWVMHGFCALQLSLCGTCAPACGGCCTALGPGCADPSSATRAGQMSVLGPRSEINAHEGTNLGTHATPTGDPALRGRLLVRDTDLNRALNPNARYYAELQAIAADDAHAGNMTGDDNNASYRRVGVNAATNALIILGGTVRELPAIHAWQVFDPDVTIQYIDIPDEGRLILAYRVTDNGDGTWHYEYALHNLNSDRSAGTFAVPVPDDVTVTNVGFHDVDYHSGEPYALDDWPAVENDSRITWSTQPFAENENANALRWGTLYNFRFDANTAPQPADITIGLFKPGTPTNVTVPALAPAEFCPAPAFTLGAPGVSFADRAFDGFIDARAESTDGVNVNLGLDTFTIEFNTPLANADGLPLDATAFTISDTAGTAPSVTNFTTEDSRTVTLTLSTRIALQQWTTITVHARAECDAAAVLNDSIRVAFLPADVDQSGDVSPFDLLAFRQFANNVSAPQAGVLIDFLDINRDGTVSPFDLLAFRQLINGTPPATRPWAGESLP